MNPGLLGKSPVCDPTLDLYATWGYDTSNTLLGGTVALIFSFCHGWVYVGVSLKHPVSPTNAVGHEKDSEIRKHFVTK